MPARTEETGGSRTTEDDSSTSVLGSVLSLLIVVGFLVAAAWWGGDEPASRQVSAAAEQVADPVRVRIPALGVDAPVGPLFLDDDGVLPPPATYEGTGWWHAGPEPGEAGPALIAGHVDSLTGPAVFHHLDDLDPGDEILVDRADGSTVTFVAERTERHPKDGFPTDEVYGATPDAQLRLVTCGGAFDRDGGRYLDNVIVWAVAAG